MRRYLLLGLIGLGNLLWCAVATEPSAVELLEVRPFRHLSHVRTVWATPNEREYARDCRGCHVYRESSRQDPQPKCADCHRDGSLAIDPARTKPAFLNDLDSLRAPDRPFVHWSHRRFDCKRCHDPIEGSPRDRGESGEMKLKRGWHTCLECHDPDSKKVPDEDKTLGAKGDEFVAGLNRALSRRPDKPETRFRHRDHLVRTQEPDLIACLRCHDPLLKSTGSDIGKNEVAAASCGGCHITSAEPVRPVQVGFEARPHDSPFAGTFPHGKHCTESAKTNEPSIRAAGCLACHTFDPGRDNYALKPTFGSDAGFLACNQCHWHQENLKVVDAAGKVDHGDIRSCAPCHDFGKGPMKTLRPMVAVTRSKLRSLALVGNDHPFITRRGGKIEVAKSCKKCHLAPIEGGLPSRIQNRRFSHDTHLPPSPTTDDCDQCHKSVTGAADPGALQSFDLDRCTECHKGAKIDADELREPTPARPVPAFPHALHLKSDKINGCGDCHEPKQSGDPVAGTLPSAMDCSKCHDHGKAPEITGHKDRAYVASCVKCHGVNGLAKGQVVKDTRVLGKGLKGAQFHPSPSARKCSECHLPGDPVTASRNEPHVFADLKYTHGRGPGFHGSFDPQRKYHVAGKCDHCHWEQLMRSTGKPLQGTSMNRTSVAPNGDRLDNYPGGPR